MKCAKCGKKLKSNEKFCTYCGYFNEDIEEESIEIDSSEDDDSFDNNWYDDDISSNDDNDEVVLEPIKEEKKPKEKKPKKEEKTKNKEPKTEKVKVEKTKPKKEKVVEEIKIKEDNEIYNQDERYIEAYIGEDYKLIKKSPFNFWAFLLNWMYFLYRKLYITGIIGLVITALVAFLYTKYFLIYALITIVVLGIGFNPYYIFIVKRKVNRILDKYEGSDSFSLEQICSESGGVNVPMALVIYFLFLVAIVLSVLKPTINTSSNTKFFKENSENEANCSSLIKQIYQEVKSNPGKVKEAICKVNKNNANYDLYLKSTEDDKVIYVYYATEKEYIVYKNSTESLEILNKKKAENRITEEEEKNLNDMKMIISNYESIHKKSLEEDKLIEQKKDKEEKLNYIFAYEEIIR